MTDALYSIADYGATFAAATAGINAAALAAYTAGGGTVYIPPGTWTITTTAGYAVRCYPGVSFAGAGKGLSILKVADAQPDYSAIFGHESGQPLTHFMLRDLTLDYNSANNPITVNPVPIQKGRVALQGFGANDVTVERCSFLHAVAVNVIQLCASSGNVRIADNDFELTGDNPTSFDHSTVYANEGPSIAITGNRFVGVSGAKMARCAIETHGDYQHVEGNTVLNYAVGMNICGTGAASSEGLHIAHNNLMDVRAAIQVWTAYFAPNTSDPAIRCAQIVHNNIRLDTDAWLTILAVGSIATNGIVLYSGLAPIDNLVVASNIIRLKPTTYAGETFDSLHAGGITAYQAPASRPAFVNRNWRITDNLIDGAQSSGILIGVRIDILEVCRNMIVDPVQLEAAILADQKAAICIDGADIGHLIVNHNRIVDSHVPARLTAGIRILDACPPHYQIVGNYVHGENVPVIGGSAFMPPDSEVPYWTLTHHAWNGPTAEEVQRYAVGA